MNEAIINVFKSLGFFESEDFEGVKCLEYAGDKNNLRDVLYLYWNQASCKWVLDNGDDTIIEDIGDFIIINTILDLKREILKYHKRYGFKMNDKQIKKLGEVKAFVKGGRVSQKSQTNKKITKLKIREK